MGERMPMSLREAIAVYDAPGGIHTVAEYTQAERVLLDHARLALTVAAPSEAGMSDELCDAIASTIKTMLEFRPVERTNDAIWRSVIRLGAAKVAHPTPQPGHAGGAGDWSEDAGHENGDYCNRCLTCGEQFTGHKRRTFCKLCSKGHAGGALMTDAEWEERQLERALDEQQ